MPERRRYLVLIPAPPPPREAREVLELILTAAGLDLPVEVVFENSAAELLAGPGAAAWRQLTEQGLAHLFVVVTTGFDAIPGLPAGVVRLAEAQWPRRFAHHTWIRA